MEGQSLRVIDKNACRSCRRPIEKLEHIGWVHGELPQYAAEESGCDKPEPVDPRCLVCGQLVASSNWRDGYVKLGRHGAPTCLGSGTAQPKPS